MNERTSSIGLIATIAAIVLISFYLDINAVKVWVEKSGVWSPLVFIILKSSTLIIAPLSGSPLYPVAGFVFGFWEGLIYTLVGDLLGISINFWLARKLRQRFVRKILSTREDSLLNRIIDRVGDIKGYFHACLTLFTMPELLSYAAGLSRLPYRSFLLVGVPFSILFNSILVFFGSILDPESGSLFIKFGIPLLGLFAIIIGGSFFLKSLKGNV